MSEAQAIQKLCANVGCENTVTRNSGKYCSHDCYMLTREQQTEEAHIRRIFEAAELAPRPESCRNCPGGFKYHDETGIQWCMCGRSVSNTLDHST